MFSPTSYDVMLKITKIDWFTASKTKWQPWIEKVYLFVQLRSIVFDFVSNSHRYTKALCTNVVEENEIKLIADSAGKENIRKPDLRLLDSLYYFYPPVKILNIFHKVT